MKIEEGKFKPETEIDQKAVDYLHDHLPLFAVANVYVVNAFIAGWEAAKKDSIETHDIFPD